MSDKNPKNDPSLPDVEPGSDADATPTPGPKDAPKPDRKPKTRP